MSKQETNGIRGENSTKTILVRHFIVHEITPDIEGRDFMAELNGNVSKVNAIIQSKFFENSNEVQIRKDYLWDEDGIKTEFFAFFLQRIAKLKKKSPIFSLLKKYTTIEN